MKKKHRIKLWISIAIIWLMWFSDFSFAAESTEYDFEWLWLTLNYILSVLAWIWVFFAKVAWEFLTNKWVYGEVFWRDALLWKFRNIVKNLANYWLWFFLVYMILKWLINQYKWQEITKNLKQTLLWVLIAWVWIQASRFLTGAVIDVSTITLVAAWSFPSQIVSGSDEVEDALKKSLPKFIGSDGKVSKVKRISLFPKTAWATNLYKVEYYDADESQSISWFIDKLMPNADDVSGPLYYIWFSVLETDLIKSVNSSDNKWLEATIFNTIMQWWTTIVFSIEMFVLCVVAVMRIVYMRMFIALSPVAVLLRCIQKSWQKLWDKDSFASKLMKHIDFKPFFINAFKPTIIVLWIWMAAILVSLMTDVVNKYRSSGEGFSSKWVTFSSTNNMTNDNWNEWDQTYTTTMDSNLVNFTLTNAWKTLLGFVLSIITVIMVYQIIKIAVTMWWKDSDDFVTRNIGKIQKSMGELMMSMPVVPVAWYDSQGVPTTHFITADKILKSDGEWGFRSEILESTINKYGKIKKKEFNVDAQEDFINNLFSDVKTKTLTDREVRTIENRRNDYPNWWLELLEKQLDNIKGFASRLAPWWGYWMTLNPDTAWNNNFWIKQFTKWLNNTNPNYVRRPEWTQMLQDWEKQGDEDKRSLKILFDKKNNNAKTYANFFGYEWDYKDFDSIKDLDFSRKE